MSREIKFRYVLRNKNTGKTSFRIESIETIEKEGLKGIFDTENYDIITRDRFAGLQDKNRTDIYEGDVLKTRTLSDELNVNDFNEYQVGFFGCSFCLIVNGLPLRQWKDGTYDWYTLENTESFEMEITGNIHEN